MRQFDSRRRDRILAVIALVSFILAWFLGSIQEDTDERPVLSQALPAAETFERLAPGVYAAHVTQPETALVGYVCIGESDGYGGPLRVAVAVDAVGDVLGVAVVEHRETPSFLARVLGSGLLGALPGKSFRDDFETGRDVDGVTGATYTVKAIVSSVRQAARKVAADRLELPVPAEASPGVNFGIPEVALVLLFLAGYLGMKGRLGPPGRARWATLLTGLIVLGFVYNNPLTLAFFTRMLAGFWPSWRTDLYSYLLAGGVVFFILVDGRNPYCDTFCPFGATQECLAKIGGARLRPARRFRRGLVWLARVVAWLAIVLALMFRNPAVSSYEVFGALFDFTASAFQFALLGLVMVASLFLRRPWCRYLCPLRPVTDFFGMLRKWGWETWRNLAHRN